jgi:Zn-dependent M28 family amino/carboxypeptidase
MLNLDMMGKRTRPAFIAGSDSASRQLADRAAAVAAKAGYEVPREAFPRSASSDHASFSAAGVPAITITSGNDEVIHQPLDTFENVVREDLAAMLEIAALVLQDLLLR